MGKKTNVFFFPDNSSASQEPDTEAAFSDSIHGKEMDRRWGRKGTVIGAEDPVMKIKSHLLGRELIHSSGEL